MNEWSTRKTISGVTICVSMAIMKYKTRFGKFNVQRLLRDQLELRTVEFERAHKVVSKFNMVSTRLHTVWLVVSINFKVVKWP